MTTLGPRAPRGARILVLSQIAKAAVLFLGITVLSRLLTPTDFGIVAVPLAVIGIGEVIRDLGLSTAATTAPSLSDNARDFLFWVSAAVGVGMMLLVVALSQLTSVFLGAGLASTVMAALAVVFLLNGLSAQYRANLTRSMRFAALAAVDSASALLGVLTAIGLALAGAGLWALAAQPVVAALSMLVLSVLAGAWVPRSFSRPPEATSLIRFGLNVAWSQGLLYIGNNLDTVVLGAATTAQNLGFYTRSYQLAIQPLGLLKAPLTSVALPLLSRRADNAPAFSKSMSIGQTLIAYTILPVAVLLSAVADPAVRLFLGDQWAPAAPIVAILAVAGAFQQLASVSSWMFLAKNEGRQLRMFSQWSLGIKAAFVVPTAFFGPLAVAAGYLLAMVITAPLALSWACRLTDVPLRKMMLGLVAPGSIAVLAGLTAFAVGLAVKETPAIVELGVSSASFLAVYAAAMLVPHVRREMATVAAIALRQA